MEKHPDGLYCPLCGTYKSSRWQREKRYDRTSRIICYGCYRKQWRYQVDASSYLNRVYETCYQRSKNWHVDMLSKSKFISLIYTQEFKDLYSIYEQGGFKPNSPEAPYLRAIDFKLGFVEGNVEWVPWIQRKNKNYHYVSPTTEQKIKKTEIEKADQEYLSTKQDMSVSEEERQRELENLF